jgi:hypothetical protein
VKRTGETVPTGSCIELGCARVVGRARGADCERRAVEGVGAACPCVRTIGDANRASISLCASNESGFVGDAECCGGVL